MLIRLQRLGTDIVSIKGVSLVTCSAEPLTRVVHAAQTSSVHSKWRNLLYGMYVYELL